MSRLSVKGTLSSTYREEKGTQINEFIHVFFFHEGTKSYDSSIIRDILRVIHDSFETTVNFLNTPCMF